MLTKIIVEDKGALWTEGIISWLSINIVSYQGKRLQGVDGAFLHCVDIPSGAAYSWGRRFKRLVVFSSFLIKQNSKTKKQDCMQTYNFLTFDNSVRQLS